MRGFSKLEALIEKFKDSETVSGMESTAHYAQTLINPLQTSVLRKAAIRHTKTDRTNTKLIVKSMIVNGYRTLTECDVRLLQLKHLERFRSKLKKSVTQQKIRLRAVMDVIFPEFQYFFASGLHIHTSYEILKLYTSPNEIAELYFTRLANLIRKASNNAFDKGNSCLADTRVLINSSISLKRLMYSSLNRIAFAPVYPMTSIVKPP
ncbi:MAG: IS110 family transposase [Ruminococcus sp.]|nr:IS110 family transposase [Ruminococcus sp.]